MEYIQLNGQVYHPDELWYLDEDEDICEWADEDEE